MNRDRKLMNVVFNAQFLMSGDLNKRILTDILDLLPEDAAIVHFGNYYDRASNFLTIQSESFSPVEEAQVLPEAVIWLKRDSKDSPVTIDRIEYPTSYKQNHTCSYKQYDGFLQTEEICVICNKKK